jgi:hypothetical protein
MLTLGCDPEFFLRHRVTHHKVSAHDKVPGTKRDPHPLPNGGSVQADGTAIEFNTEPATNDAMFHDNVMSCLNDIRKMVPQKFEFCFIPCVEYGPRSYERIPDDAKVLGCDPDYNAYSLQANERPVPPRERLRTGAGHIHIGWTNGIEDVHAHSHMEDCAFFVKKLDATLYWDAGAYWAKGKDEDLRRKVYGAMGAFRPKSFGVEYRSLSNSWLGAGRFVHSFIYKEVQSVFNRAMDPKGRYPLPPRPPVEYNRFM